MDSQLYLLHNYGMSYTNVDILTNLVDNYLAPLVSIFFFYFHNLNPPPQQNLYHVFSY